MPKNLQEILDEVYVALQNGTRVLAAVGARTTLDILALDKLGDLKTFQAKLDALQGAGHVTPHERDLLEVLTEAGNASAHRGFRPNENDLVTVMDVLEGILEKVYVLDARQKELAARAKQLKTMPVS